jgi:acylglycerol lipase
VRLYTSTQLPDTEPVGVVSFVLGPEISSAPLYPEFVAALHEAGFATAVLHPRGTGYSPGLRGDLDDYRLFLADQRLGFEHLRARFGGRPIFLVGHSVGAAFALEVSAKAPQPPAGVVLVNPAYKLLASEGMTPSFGDYLTFAANMVFRPAALTVDMNSRPSAVAHPADRAEGMAMQADPLVVRYFSLRYMLSQRQVMDRCVANAAATSAPVLLVQGGKDALVDPRGSDEILAAAKSRDKTKLLSPEAGHGSSAVETMVEPIVSWLKAHSGGGGLTAQRRSP